MNLVDFIDKTGIVKDEAFFAILSLHGMNLTDQEKSKLKKKYSKGGKMVYKDAL